MATDIVSARAMIDEEAFVESLFSPEMKSSPSGTPHCVSPLNISTSTRNESMKSPQLVMNDEPLLFRLSFNGPEEDADLFGQLLDTTSDEDADMSDALHENADDSDHLSDLEPLAFTNDKPDLIDPVFSREVFGSGPSSPSSCRETNVTQRQHEDFHSTPRNRSNVGESMMPIMPLRSTEAAALNESNQTILLLQSAMWGVNSSRMSLYNGDVKKLIPNPNVVPMSTYSQGMANASGKTKSMWASGALLTPAGQHPPPDLSRKISSKKSTARLATEPTTMQMANMTSSSSLLAASLHECSAMKPDPSLEIATKVAVKAEPPHAPGFATAGSASKTFKGKKCIEPGCVRRAQSNSRCKAHGGGARCQYKGPGGCTRSSQGGGFCRAHGGGKRCEFPGCTRGQQRKGRCYVHGGIRKCQVESCEKKDRGNGFCIAHGGGKRCEVPGCSRAVRRGTICQVHELELPELHVS